MFRRQVASCSTASSRRIIATTTTSSSTALLSASLRFNSDNASANTNNAPNPNETEAEREARMRQEMMNRMMGGRNPFAGMFNRTQSGQQANTGGFGGVPRGYDASNYKHWANTPFHQQMRFWCSVLIFITGIYMMRRMGILGDYTHLTLPFYAASPADQSKWVLFIFNIEDSRRRQLVQEWETKKLQNPNMNFFDYVDAQEQHWRSSPNFSAEQVISAVGGAMRTQGPPRAITSIKATLNTSNFFTSTIFGGTGNPAEERAKRIDGMMTTLGAALNPMAAMMGNSSSGAAMPQQQQLPPQLQQQLLQQQQQGGGSGMFGGGQQFGGSGGMFSGNGLTAISTGSVSPERQQQYGGMNIPTQQLQQQGYNQRVSASSPSQQQPQYNNYNYPPSSYGGQQQYQQQQPQSNQQSNSGSGSNDDLSYAQRAENHSFATGNAGVVANLQNYTNSSNSNSEDDKKENHQCEVKFFNEEQQPNNNNGQSNKQ